MEPTSGSSGGRGEWVGWGGVGRGAHPHQKRARHDAANAPVPLDSRGFGSVSREQTERSTFDTVSAGDHWSFKMSRQMAPDELMLQW